MVALLTVYWAIYQYGGPVVREYGENIMKRWKGIFDTAREDHLNAVKKRIDEVKKFENVVDVTKNLFEVSKVGSLRRTTSRIRCSRYRRKLHSLKRRLSSSSNGLLWLPKQNRSWIHGCGMKVR